MTRFSRRRFLELSAGGVALGSAIPLLQNPMFRRALYAADCDVDPAKKLLVIFLRGGNDGVNTVIPRGDVEYNPLNRPSLLVPESASIDLNGFAALHPALEKLHDLFLTGRLAVVHRVGYTGQSRSHFSSQQFWENAEPGGVDLEEGWIQRMIASDPILDDHPLAAASISPQLQLLFRGSRALAHIRDLEAYDLGNEAVDLKFLGALPRSTGEGGSGLLGIYSGTGFEDTHEATVRASGLALAANLDHLACLGVDPGSYAPFGGATYPDSDTPEEFSGTSAFTFFRQVRDAAQLLKETDVRVVGLEIGGFDNHSNQGSLEGTHARRLEMVAHAIRSLSLDLQGPTDIWNDTLILTLSEFGRTSAENASGGTDHGEASVLFVAGGAVLGDVWNCDSSTWASGDLFSTPNARYVAHRTDFRACLAEICDRHFGLAGALDDIIPGWSTLAGPEYGYPGFLS